MTWGAWEARGAGYWRRFALAGCLYTALMVAGAAFILGFGDPSVMLFVGGATFYAVVGLSIVALFRTRRAASFALILALNSGLLRAAAILPSAWLIDPVTAVRLVAEQLVLSTLCALLAFWGSSAYWRNREDRPSS